MPTTTDREPANCNANAMRVRQGDVERCVCNPGYSGDGVSCEGKQLIEHLKGLTNLLSMDIVIIKQLNSFRTFRSLDLLQLLILITTSMLNK